MVILFLLIFFWVVILVVKHADSYNNSSNDTSVIKPTRSSFLLSDAGYIEKFQNEHPSIELNTNYISDHELCVILKNYPDQLITRHSFYSMLREYSFDNWLQPTSYYLSNRRRFDRAKKESFRFFLIDHNNNIGFCQSSRDPSKEYLVSFKICTCRDCEVGHIPCKHMYALALRLGTIQPDHFMYPIPKDRADLLSALYKESPYVVDTFYSYLVKLSDDKMYTRISREEVVLHTNCDFNAMQILADNGFIKIASPSDFDFLDYVETTYTIDDFKKEALGINPLCKFPSRMRKHELFEYICSNDPYLTDFIYHKCFHIIISQEYVNLRYRYKEYIFYECEKHSYDLEIYD